MGEASSAAAAAVVAACERRAQHERLGPVRALLLFLAVYCIATSISLDESFSEYEPGSCGINNESDPSSLSAQKKWGEVRVVMDEEEEEEEKDRLLQDLRRALRFTDNDDYIFVQSYKVLHTLEQSSSRTFIVQLQYSRGSDSNNSEKAKSSASEAAEAMIMPNTVFVKDMDVSYLSNRHENRTNDDATRVIAEMLYRARTDVLSCTDILPRLAQKGFLAAPAVYLAEYNDDDNNVNSADQDEYKYGTESEKDNNNHHDNDDKNHLQQPQQQQQRPAPDKRVGGLLILETIDMDRYHQPVPLSFDQARLSLAALARMHAAAWRDADLFKLLMDHNMLTMPATTTTSNRQQQQQQYKRRLQQQQQQQQHRNLVPTHEQRLEMSLNEAIDNWNSFYTAFSKELHEAGLRTDRIRDLGVRVAKLAPSTSRQMLGTTVGFNIGINNNTVIGGDGDGADDNASGAVGTRGPFVVGQYATLIHGDYKSKNVFLSKTITQQQLNSRGKEGAIIIDYAHIGVGGGMEDVAYHIHHSVDTTALVGTTSDSSLSGEWRLVRHYWETLHRTWEEQKREDQQNREHEQKINMSSSGENGSDQERGDDDSDTSDDNDLLNDDVKYDNTSSSAVFDDSTYPWHVASHHYRLAVIDRFRRTCKTKWANATPESFAAVKDRDRCPQYKWSVPAAMHLIRQADHSLSKMEAHYYDHWEEHDEEEEEKQ